MILDRDLEADLALALELADIADDITLPFYDERSFNLTWKTNRTEVTEADRLTESAISAAVAARRPDDGLLGEEHGVVGNVESLWRWVIDPIDGTSNFVRGI
ncbi:MAG: inositol monophosphatase family protein, partial [Ilumatobacteraceae bacterium]